MDTPPRSDLPVATTPSSPPDMTTLLSPSKALALASSNVSWTQVLHFLTPLFSPSAIPPFERNAVTLAALLALINANQDADEERRVVWDALRETLQRSVGPGKVDAGGPGEAFMRDLNAKLSPEGRTALDDIAASAVLLGCPSHHPSHFDNPSTIPSLSASISTLRTSLFDASNQLCRLQRTSQHFSLEEVRLRDTLAKFTSETDPQVLGVEEMHSRTWTMNRESKVVGMKLGEYHERIRLLRGYEIGSVRTEDVVTKEERVGKLRREIGRLEERVLEMKGLPPDLDVSRKEVERARGELEEWKRRREMAFEGLVE